MNRRVHTNLVFPAVIAGTLSVFAGCDGQSDNADDSVSISQSESGAHLAAPEGGDTTKASDFVDIAPTTSYPWLEYQNDYLCLLSYVGGDYNAEDHGWCLIEWPEANYWTAHWEDGMSTTRAICTNWNNFVVPSGGDKWISEGAKAEYSGRKDGTTDATGWQGDAVTFLRGVGGELQSNTEYAQITQPTTISGYANLRVHTEVPDLLDYSSISGWSHSVFVGVPQAHLAYLIGYDTNSQSFVRGTVKSSGVFEFPVSTDTGFSSYWLSDVNDGVCSFTYISGNFDGAEERIRIYQNGGNWFVKAWAHSGKHVYGRARCMAYDQR